MPVVRWRAGRLVAVATVAVLVGALLTWLAVRATGAHEADVAALPACAERLGTELGAVGEDPAWNGCVTDGGAAVRSYGYECSGLRESLAPRGEQWLADEAAVVFLPDAGLMSATSQPWVESRMAQSAFLRTPLTMLVHYRCDELRSLPPQDGIVSVDCALDDVPLDLVTTQGCVLEGQFYAAVGRVCSYPDFDLTTSWEQWSIDVPDLRGVEDEMVLESGPDEQWWAVPAAHRDERCSTPPDEWDQTWS
jgi:hypothetical protein